MMALLVMMGSCNPEKLSVSDYLEWVNNPENGLKVSKELNDYKFELLYKPVEYIAINEQRKLDVDTISYYHRIKELKEMQYYTLKIETLTGLEMMKAGIAIIIMYGKTKIIGLVQSERNIAFFIRDQLAFHNQGPCACF